MNKINDVQYLETILKGFVYNPENIVIEKITDDRGILLTLTVSKKDMGAVIGKNGATIHSIKRLLYALGAKYGERINLKVLDPHL